MKRHPLYLLALLLFFCTLFGVQHTHAACNAQFISSQANCPTVQFTDLSTSNSGAITQWSWTFGDGGTSTAQNPTHTYAANGTYNVCLLIITQFGCGSQFCATVTIGCVAPPPCAADFGANLSGCPQILFTDSSAATSGTINSWSWTFGDGGTSTSQNPAHTYLTNGSYVVCLTIGTTTGCQSSYCDTIAITCNATCDALFQSNSAQCPLISFFDGSTTSSGTITGYSWDFGDGGTSTLMNPTHTYAANGTYQVCLTITTSTGCTDSYCTSLAISCIQPNCAAAFQANLSGCPQILFQDLSSAGSGSITNWSWTFGDGGTSTSQNPAHTYLTNGSYAVCLTIGTSTGCQSSYCDTIAITCNATCNALFQYSLGQCPLISFFNGSTTSSGTITAYSWDFGDGGTSTLMNPTHTYAANGTYQVCLTITTSTGCTDSYCTSLTISCIQPNCAAAFQANLNGCPQILFTDFSSASSGTITSWSWTFGDGGTSTSQNPAHTYLINGNYAVCLTIGTSTGCQSTHCDTIAITCNATCNAAFTANTTPNLFASFSDQSTGAPGVITTWAWTFGDGGTANISDPSHIYAQAGIYVVCLTITTSMQCTDTYCDTITVGTVGLNNAAPSIHLTAAPNPFDDDFQLEYSLATWENVVVGLYDVQGKLLQQIASGEQSPGLHRLTVDGTQRPAGMYLVRLQTATQVHCLPMMRR